MKTRGCARRVWALAKKEIRSFLLSPVCYLAAVFFTLFLPVNLFFFNKFFLLDAASMRPFFSAFPFVYIFIIPAITIKNWAEEKKLGTIELLLVMPFSETELCLGKFLSSLAALFVLLVLSAALPLSIFPLGDFDPALVFTEYLGAFLLGAAGTSLALFLSALLKNQAASFLCVSAILFISVISGEPGAFSFLPDGISGFVNYISLSFHFSGFTRGFLDTRDLSFFVLSAALFLFLNTRVLAALRRNGKTNAGTNTNANYNRQLFAVSSLWIFIIILLFLISSRIYFRVDLTKNKTNTLSEFSRELCKKPGEPLVITYYISDRLAGSHPLPGEASDLLGEYAASSNGMIRFIRKDPGDSAVSLELKSLGISPQRMMTEEKNESTLTDVYSAILVEYLDRSEILPWVFSIDTLEFEISSRILSLTAGTEREIGIITGDSAKNWENFYGLLNFELAAAGFKARPLGHGDEIPQNLRCLFVLCGASDIDGSVLYKIDNYIRSGGAALFAVDTILVDFETDFSVRPVFKDEKGLLAALASYGVILRPAFVLEKDGLILNYESQNSGGNAEVRTISYPQWLGLSSGSGNQNHKLGRIFQGIDLYWASPLELYPPEDAVAIPLFSSGNEAWLQTKDFTAQFETLSFFESERESTSGKKILAAALEGSFPSAFAGLPETQRENPGAGLPEPLETAKASRIVVIGDSDFAGDLMAATGAEKRNTSFLTRAAAWLSGDDGLLEIRNRGESGGRLDKIEDAGKKRAAEDFAVALNIFIVPSLVLAAWITITIKRRRP